MGSYPAPETQAESEHVYQLTPLDFPVLLLDGVPEVEYIDKPYFPKLARVWVWGATGSYKSLYCQWVAAKLSREGVRVSYFSEENPVQEELRRLAKLQPDAKCYRLFHRTGMDLMDPHYVESLLDVTRGDAIVFLDSWTDLWSGDEGDNRAVQQFDASVMKPLQAQGVTPVVLHHTGHRQMFSDRGGATAGRGASSLGQKADVVLEFKDAGEDRFTVVYGKCRIGGIRHVEQSYKVCEDGGQLTITAAGSPEELATRDVGERMVLAIMNAPAGYLTTTELRAAIGGNKQRQSTAMDRLEDDPRVTHDIERIPLARRQAPGRCGVASRRGWVGGWVGFQLRPGGTGTTHPPIGVGDGFPPSTSPMSNPSQSGGDGLGTCSPPNALQP